jgi:hypothetical protein
VHRDPRVAVRTTTTPWRNRTSINRLKGGRRGFACVRERSSRVILSSDRAVGCSRMAVLIRVVRFQLLHDLLHKGVGSGSGLAAAPGLEVRLDDRSAGALPVVCDDPTWHRWPHEPLQWQTADISEFRKQLVS